MHKRESTRRVGWRPRAQCLREWSWRIRVDMVDPVTGKRRQPQRTYRTKREAEAGLAQ